VLNISRGFALVRCHRCKLVYANGHYDVGFLADEYYGGRAAVLDAAATRPGVDRKHLELDRYERISAGWLGRVAAKPGACALDVGCHTGLLLDALRERGFETWGVERSPAALIAQQAGHQVLHCDLEGQPVELDQRFELITSTHVLEHLRTPVRVLKWIAEHLTQDGRAVIEVPNWGDLLRPLWGKHYRPLELGDHISFFTGSTLANAANEAGLRVETMWSGPRVAGLVFPNILSAADRLRALRRTVAAPGVASRGDAGEGAGPANRGQWMRRVLQVLDAVDPALERVLGATWRGPNIVAILSSNCVR